MLLITNLLFFFLVTMEAVLAQSDRSLELTTTQGPFEVRLEKSVLIPMRDGTRLSTDLYFPVGAGDDLPTILFRDPYNKNTGRAGTN